MRPLLFAAAAITAVAQPQTRWWYVAGALALGALAWAVFGRG